MKRFFCLLLLVCFVGTVADSAQVSESVAKRYQDGFAAFGAGDFARAVEQFTSLYRSNSGDDSALYLLAASLAKAGKSSESIAHLNRLADLRSCYTPSPQTFSALKDSTDFQKVLDRMQPPAVRGSRKAFTIPERDFFPEGVAYDERTKYLYIGSIYKRKISRIHTAQTSPQLEEFTSEGQDGIFGVLGMKVDAQRQQLWAVTTADVGMKGFSEKQDQGKTAVFQYDLTNRKLIKKYPLPQKPQHFLNDLVIDNTGRVYVTDTHTGEVWTISPGGSALEVFFPAGQFASLNGIAISDDDKTLFIADVVKGVYAIDIKTKTAQRLMVDNGIETGGIDGLYFYRNSIIGIANAISTGRVARFYLSDNSRAVQKAEILDCRNPIFEYPSTGALADDNFYFIANAQFRSYNADGTPFPLEKLNPIVILQVSLQ